MSSARFVQRITFLKLVWSNRILNNSFVTHFMGGVPGKENEVGHFFCNICEDEMILGNTQGSVIGISWVVCQITWGMEWHH